MSDETSTGPVNRAPPRGPRLALPMTRARAVILWERLWRSFWAPASILGLFVAIALMDVLPLLPGWAHGVVVVAFAGGLLAALWRGVRHLSLPRRSEARRRLEQATGLVHRPLQALNDRIAGGGDSDDSRALWVEHQRRMAEAAHRLRAGVPDTRVGELDPLALRAAVFLLLAVGLAVGWSDPVQRLARAVQPQIGPLASAAAPKLEIWITPPEYTRLAPLFPKSEGLAGQMLHVPRGSKLIARVAGGRGTPTLVRGVDDLTAFEQIDARNSQIETEITGGDRLEIRQGGATLGFWPMTVVPDAPPAIAFAKPPFATKAATLGIAFTAADDYGVAEVQVEIRRTYEDGAVVGKEVTELKLPLPAQAPKTANETSFHDLAPHHWAGLPVTLTLRAVDVAGQTARSERADMVLPEREFRHPVARAIIEQRKRLTTEPQNRRSIYHRLGEVAEAPDAFNNDTVVFLGLIAARERLRHEREATAIAPVRDLLWATALRVEDGQLSLAERELRRLERELMRALSENAPDEELERLMRELEMAMNRYLRELAEMLQKQAQNQEPLPFDPRMRMIQSQDFQRMLDQIRQLMRAGARDAARQMLAQLRNLMESLRSARLFQGSPRNSQAGKMMQQLQEMIRRQSDLMNQTFRQSRRMTGPNAAQSRSGAQEQRALREMLRQFREMMGRMGQGQPQQGQNGPGKALGEADRQMGQALEGLQRNAPGQAVGPMGEALNQLQQAGRGMMQQMMRQFSRESGMGLQGRFDPLQVRRDPLGRLPPGEGGFDTRDVVVPDEGAVERVQRILEELRRRSGQHHRPQFELDYIDRLLRRF